MLEKLMLRQAISLFKKGKYRLSIHADNERAKDKITISEIEECFKNGTIQIIENYPEDQRGHSFLLLGYTDKKKAVHFVCAQHEETLIIITIYRPDPRLWVQDKERKK